MKRLYAFFFLSILIVFLSCDSPQNQKKTLSTFGQEIISSDQKISSFSLLRVSPTGEDVASDRQIVFQFNKNVSPLGEMSRNENSIPIVFTPHLQCAWRWISQDTLACQLTGETPFNPATRYSISLRDESKEDQTETKVIRFAVFNFLAKEKRSDGYLFTSQRPSVSSFNFSSWNTPGILTIAVYFSQPVERSSIEKHLYFEAPEHEKIAASVLPDPSTKKQEDIMSVALIQPKSELPLYSNISLIVEPGLKNPKGTEEGVEQREVFSFDTHESPAFLGIRCCVEDSSVNDDERNKNYCASDFEGLSSILLEPGEAKKCNPQGAIAFAFSSPVESDEVVKALTLTPTLSKEKSLIDLKESFESYSSLESFHEKGKEYLVYLPSGLIPNTAYSAHAADIKDIFGRTVQNSLDTSFYTSDRLPRFVVDDSQFVLEKNALTHLPSVVQNIDSINLSFSAYTQQGKISESKTIPVDNIQNLSYFFPIKLRDFLPGSGIVSAKFSTSPTSRNSNFSENETFVGQITPFHIEVKYGHFNTLVWITDLSTGKPVEGVMASINKHTHNVKIPEKEDSVLATVLTDSSGFAELPGSTVIDPDLSLKNTSSSLYVLASKDNDIGFVPLDWSYRTGPYATDESRFGHMRVWGMTPQGVYKLGDKVEYKIVVRDQDLQSLTMPPRDGYSLTIIDPLGKVVHSVDSITLSEFGTYSGSFVTPSNGTTGLYEFKLSAHFAPKNKSLWMPENEKKTKGRSFSVMQLLITDFSPSPIKVSTEVSKELFHPQETVVVETSAKLHAGGAFINAPAKINAKITTHPFDDLPSKLSNFYFSTSKVKKLDEEIEPDTVQLPMQNITLNNEGRASSQIQLPESDIYFGDLIIESSVQDDRGNSIAQRTTKKYAGPSRFVGGKFDSWISETGKSSSLLLSVIDEEKNIVKGAPITVTITRTETIASQVKSEGNAYLTKFEDKEVPVSTCSLTSESEPVACSLTPTHPGIHTFWASVTDQKGMKHETKLTQYVIGGGDVVWKTDDEQNIDLTPESSKLFVGDTAKIFVKNPFPGAHALLTVERYGIISKKILTLESATPIIDIPITQQMAPGIYVSLSIFSPRVDAPIKEGSVDLGKPALRIGSTKIEVSEREKILPVTVSIEKDVYKPGESVRGSIRVKNSSSPSEVAIAVLDEAVYDLILKGREYFNPQKQLYALDDLNVTTFDNLLRIIGKREFKKKGANSGGDGLSSSERDGSKFVALWNPSLITDKEGNASFSFEAPGNLTRWHVFAVALNNADLMGLGEGELSVTKEIEIRPNTPHQVLEGDSFSGEFTVLNRTNSSREVTVKIIASGAIQEQKNTSQSVSIAPLERKIITLPLEAQNSGEITFHVDAHSGEFTDSLRHSISVNKKAALLTSASYGSVDSESAVQSIAYPKDMRTDIGNLHITLSPTILGNIEGSFEYMKEYPFGCWEQKLSKGILAFQYQQLKNYLPNFLWDESLALTEEMLHDAASFQAPNGGFAYFIPKDEYVDPYLSALTSLSLGWLEGEGISIQKSVKDKLNAYLLSYLRKDTSPSFYTTGMAATSRGVILSTLSSQKIIKESEVLRFKEFIPHMSLFGKAMYYQALLNFPSLKKEQKDLRDKLFQNSYETSGKVSFQESIDTSSFERILTTPIRDNCALVTALLSTPENVSKDMPMKMIRSISETRKQSNAWPNTQENLFCTQAFITYAKHFESTPPSGKWLVSLNGTPLGASEFNSVRDTKKSFTKAFSEKDPGTSSEVIISREGTGRAYFQTLMSYAPRILSKEALTQGIEIKREYSIRRNGAYVTVREPLSVKRGDVVRVDLFLNLPAARNFVALTDPIPGGFQAVNSELKTASEFDSESAESPLDGGSYWYRHNDWIDYATSRWSFYHRELTFNAAKFYSEYLPPGNYHLSYAVQAIAPGAFTILPAKAEEMYDPDVFGLSEANTLKVE